MQMENFLLLDICKQAFGANDSLPHLIVATGRDLQE